MPLRFFKMAIFATCVTVLTSLTVACGGGEQGPTPTPFTGDWEQFDDTDPITDKGNIGIWLEASDDDVRTGLLGVLLYVRCSDSEGLDVFVAWPEDVGDELAVDWRVDNDDPDTKVWKPTSHEFNQATFHPDQESAIDDLRKAERISVQVYSKSRFSVNLLKAGDEEDEDAMTAVFHPAGFEDAYKSVEKVCQ